MNLDAIKRVEWYADWSGPFPLLEVSTSSSDIYLSALKTYFGKSFTHFLVLYHEGIASARLPQQEFRELGEYLATKVQDPVFVQTWARRFKETADALTPQLRLPPTEFFSALRSLHKSYQEYGTYNVATKVVFDYLPFEARDARGILEDARKYSETFYKDSAEAFSRMSDMLEQRTGYPKQLLLMMTREELYGYQDTGRLPEQNVLQQRYACCGLYGDREGTHILSKEQVEEVEKFWLQDAATKELTGTPAYPGKVRGICRVVLDYHNAQVQEGEILVTGMTDPNFLPLMKKVAAIVTDGGGLLSHAAIVSRELKKPCVIGTKVATKMLKDGDLVEVDADAGVVRKL